ncbi:isocitrate/isopropylmalate dehydrogenase family protein [Agaribacter marinus]|uniref:3-isopropylmalate dehydrogenase n=1 Tax=Agaribacter marinus TaxID=1431249 RepID=A0AA37SZN6_9ALTE|nr:isocitrate/isopropylmalate dehydrogenase family protein [Agaribacter marinus]GLR69518.1 3-isopropylmalate dehydrogenase [Agaribacter marinus]
MQDKSRFTIAVFPGDGIGSEITPITLEVINKACSKLDVSFDFKVLDAGAAYYAKHGESLPAEAMSVAKKADAILLACMGMPDIRYPDGREIAPQLELRETLDLYAGVRPVKTLKGLPLPLGDARAQALDFVLVRESTEGLFASRSSSKIIDNERAEDTQVITRKGSERVFNFACKLAQRRKELGFKGKVTCVDKANVLGSFFFFRQVFDEVTQAYKDIDADHIYVDAAALQLVRQPWMFDVMVTENMFGDILSDLGAGLMGGMGMAPSADIGDEHAVFQPCHGSAPDIVGQGKANPTAMFLSAAMMLDWLGSKHDVPAACDAAQRINRAVETAYEAGNLKPFEFGGQHGTDEIYNRIIDLLDA